MNRRIRISWRAIASSPFLAALLVLATTLPNAARAAPDGCAGPAVEKEGQRRLALVVGVGKYKNPRINPLAGPANDVRAFTGLLGQYGFPAENVCVLQDEQATLDGFEAAFQKALIERARPGDVAVVYYSGHGSQLADDNGDEPSGYDQSLVLHDSRTGGRLDLRDDRLNQLLEKLYAKTTNLVVILDSCNSGSATRGPGAGTFTARYQPPPGMELPASGQLPGRDKPWVPAALPEMIFFAAAADGTSALETGGHGIFTDALVQVLGAPARPLTWAQAARQIPGMVAARSPQVPFFHGHLDRQLFGGATLARPSAWEVKKVGSMLELAGPPLPGMGLHAELRIHAPSANPKDYADPARAKALAVVVEVKGLTARAAVPAGQEGAAGIAPGDLAVLVRPSDEAGQISVRFRPPEERGGIPKQRAAALKTAIQKDPDASKAVHPTSGPGDFELLVLGDGRLQLRGRENEIRNTLRSDQDLVQVLWQHARQRAISELRGEGGSDFTDDESLQVEIVPASADEQGPCGRARLAEFTPRPPAGPPQPQVVPLCLAWQVKVTVSRSAAKPLLVGGVVLWNDGSTSGFPVDGHSQLLRPGESYTFEELFRSKPPLGPPDFVKVFGTRQTNPVEWYRLTGSVATRGQKSAAPPSSLQRALDRYVTPGARGGGMEGVSTGGDSTWTLSTLALQVEANPRFAEPSGDASAQPAAREYTIRNFDVRPYLPAPSTGLYKVLKKADELARTQVGYKQHAWQEGSDEANLKKGIDCSRAIHFAFTRAGLPYNKKNAYLATADMVTSKSAMGDYFDRCDGQARQLGDVIVYRDDQKGDGHVVMVIDPQKRIAWGSHGWDGSGKELKVEPETGVEYQLIKYKPDWDRWDRKNMKEKACWRYRLFATEARTPEGQPGADGFESDPCGASSCPGVNATASRPRPPAPSSSTP